MALPDSPDRTELHRRSIELRGYRRRDGLYEIDGRVVDTKSHGMKLEGRRERALGEPIHDMWVRLVVDEDLVVKDIVASVAASPFALCSQATEPMRLIVGERIQAGWSARVKKKLGGAKGCTHLMELLIPLATAAYQTVSGERGARPDVLDARGRPMKIDSCYAYASDREIVQRRWPAFAQPPGTEKPSA